MTSVLPNPALPDQVAALCSTCHLTIIAATPAVDFSGNPTTRFTLARPENLTRTLDLELSQSFNPTDPRFTADLHTFFTEAATRLRNPRPDCYLTLTGIPLSFFHFAWPFHLSTAGADTSLVHGQIKLEDGLGSILHAKIAAAMTLTFREIVPAPEQPFAEAFLFNAVRKTLDQGQIELVKSGNRQPVPITTRYYSARNQKFSFNDTTAAEREAFLAAKTFWLSGILGASEPVWLLDPRDAQYLNTTPAELNESVNALISTGLLRRADQEFATPTDLLLQRKPHYEAELAQALASIKPSFNEDMRSGLTNM